MTIKGYSLTIVWGTNEEETKTYTFKTIKEMELQRIYSMTVEEKFQYIKDKGHIIDPHELDIFFQFENPDKPTKSELRTLDLIVGEIMSEWRYLKWEEEA